MALDSNRPLNRVNSGSDGIWDGAAWGLGAGAAATGMMYGATVHGSKHLDSLNQKRFVSGNNKLAAKNKLTDNRLAKRVANSEMMTYRMNQMQSVGGSLFGGKRAMLTGAAGLMGGMVAGAITDHMK
jgi:hypothetical protein